MISVQQETSTKVEPPDVRNLMDTADTAEQPLNVTVMNILMVGATEAKHVVRIMGVTCHMGKTVHKQLETQN